MNIYENNKPKKQLTKVQLTITLILILFFSITGATYAYLAISAINNNTITGIAATVNLTLDVTKIFPTAASTNTGVMVPQLSTSESNTSALSTALKNGCIDANNNVVCQVYKIDIENDGGTATQVVDGWVSFYSDSAMTTDVSTVMPNLRWKLIDSIDTITPANSVLGTNTDLAANANENVFANDITMVTDSSFTYYMIIWINETNADQSDKSTSSSNPKRFYGKIEFNSSNGTGVTSTFTA
ncbi:MAG: hypothetical protein IJ509_00350 [Bacilli bacterium]|nr:hypothetical protein [Bacilli bacterium]